ncbi:MAG: hypothetical protein ABSH52_10665 [Terriglobia bacterium]|jgi:hypothetical protein
MIIATLVLILSAAMFFFYFQTICQRILHRQFEREYFQSIAKMIHLEFPSLQKSLEGVGAPVDDSRLPKTLKDDFLALTYLLKNVATANPRYSKDERLLILFFHLQLLSLAVRRLLRVGEKKAILELTSVLGNFANVVGQQVDIMQRLTSVAEVPGDARGA